MWTLAVGGGPEGRWLLTFSDTACWLGEGVGRQLGVPAKSVGFGLRDVALTPGPALGQPRGPWHCVLLAKLLVSHL